ncbi:MAG: epoxyqueuosine reductase, partial [Clostridium perfringens]|nr:epoxyqueuosine reductase [Clostridium perfringens]
MINETLSQEIYNVALQCGFDNCGIIPLSDLDGYKERLDERRNKVPQSKDFYERMKGFTKIQEHYPWAKAIIICTTWFGKYRYP